MKDGILRFATLLLLTCWPGQPGEARQDDSPAAEGPVIRMSINKEALLLNDTLNITILIKGFDLPAIAPPVWPEIPGFIQVDQSSSVLPSIAGGRSYTLCRFFCSYIPTEPGITTIPPISLTGQNLKYHSQPAVIKILNPDGTENPAALSQRIAPERTESPHPEIAKLPARPEIKIIPEISTASPYLGEPVVLTYKLLTNISIGRSVAQTRRPEFQNFWAESIPTDPSSPSESLRAGGSTYFQFILSRWVLFPIKEGPVTIEPAEWRVTAKYERPQYREEEKLLATEAVNISVRPLPPPPAGLAQPPPVGDYQLNFNYSSRRIQLGQAFPIYLTIKGTGNIRSLPMPVLPEIQDFNIVSTRVVHTRFIPGEARPGETRKIEFTGEKVWEILLYPKKSGSIIFPALVYPFYDPALSQYQQTATARLEFDVVQFSETSPATLADAGSTSGPVPLNRLLVYLCILLLASSLLIWFYLRRNRTLRPQLAGKQGTATVETLLDEAEGMVFHKGAKAFYDLLQNAILLMLEQALGSAVRGMSREELEDVLLRKNFLKDEICGMMTILDSCDLARFAGVRLEGPERKAMLEKVKIYYRQLHEQQFIKVE